MQFTKRPIDIEATQWFKNGDHPLDYSRDHDGLEGGELRTFTAAERKANDWEGDIVRYYRHPGMDSQTPCKHCGQIMHIHGWIDTLEGGHIVCPGDWIITGVKGEHYPCKPDIFEATYLPKGPGMSFGLAIEALKQGKRVARAGWNGKGMWLAMIQRASWQVDPAVNGTGAYSLNALPWIGMKTADEGFVPWLASQTDMLADDWAIV